MATSRLVKNIIKDINQTLTELRSKELLRDEKAPSQITKSGNKTEISFSGKSDAGSIVYDKHITSSEMIVLKAKIHCNKGKNSKVINPIAEPAPWILEDIVTFSFDSFTLNNPDSIPAPTAKAEIEIKVNTANTLETVIIFLKIIAEANSKKAPNHTSHAL